MGFWGLAPISNSPAFGSVFIKLNAIRNLRWAKTGEQKVTINQTCGCGAKLQAKDELAGKQVKCPACGVTLRLPSREVAPPHIRVNCLCGKAFQVKASSAGRAFQCSGCNRSLTVPNSMESSPGKPNSQSFGTNDPASIPGSLFDQNFADIPFPAATYIPPSTPAHPQPSQSRSKPKSKKGSPNDDQDVLVKVTAILCILFGIGNVQILYLVFFQFQSVSITGLLSLDGMQLLVMPIVCIGISIAGVGLLLKKDWSMQLGQVAGSGYFLLAAISLVFTLVRFISLAPNSLMGGILVSYLTTLILRSIVPGLLLYVISRGTKTSPHN